MYEIKLEQAGYNVILAKDGAEAMDLLIKKKPDLILLDIILPMLDGFSVLERIKMSDDTKNIKVVLLTNLGTDEDVEKGKKLGAIDYFVKAELTPSQVATKVKKILEQ